MDSRYSRGLDVFCLLCPRVRVERGWQQQKHSLSYSAASTLSYSAAQALLSSATSVPTTRNWKRSVTIQSHLPRLIYLPMSRVREL